MATGFAAGLASSLGGLADDIEGRRRTNIQSALARQQMDLQERKFGFQKEQFAAGQEADRAAIIREQQKAMKEEGRKDFDSLLTGLRSQEVPTRDQAEAFLEKLETKTSSGNTPIDIMAFKAAGGDPRQAQVIADNMRARLSAVAAGKKTQAELLAQHTAEKKADFAAGMSPADAAADEDRDARLAFDKQKQADLQADRAATLPKRSTVVGRTPEDTKANAQGRQEGKDAAGASARLKDRAVFNVRLGRLLKDARELGGGVAGLRAAAGEVGGGLLGQINKSLGDSATQFIAGMNQDELTDFRTNARALVSMILPDVTQEDTGRFTDTERELAATILRATDAKASDTQLISALQAMTSFSVLQEVRDRVEAGQGLQYDFSSVDGIAAALQAFRDKGLTDTKALRLLADVETLQDALASQ